MDVIEQVHPVIDEKSLLPYVEDFHKNAASYLSICRQNGSPLYLFDEYALLKRAQQFTSAFKKYFSDFRAYFAVKSNNHPLIAKTLVGFGMGLDVSSGLELSLGLSCGSRDILFSGPGKTERELYLAVKHNTAVTVLMDSFGELERLEKSARKKKCLVPGGVRICTDENGLWRKFGIPLSSLESFMEVAEKCPHVDVIGLQFHTSWNHNPDRQTQFIKKIGQTLRLLSKKRLSMIKFIDIGGGYWPERGEWLQPAGTPAGQLLQSLGPENFHSTEHYKIDASSIETFASQLAGAMKDHIFPLIISCGVKAEPGRWLCDDAMHILLTVVDKKADDLVITDGGINLVGWERFETDYAPVINITRPSLTERECLILGSLCTPRDIWGHSYFGDCIEPGDVLLIPAQGAYTYSLRQRFIKPLAKIVKFYGINTVKNNGSSPN
ncbi:MAG: hypothetical protein AUJ48_01290 [Deltaproteobacteria bacterium CG1_02_45_11]|nr:MAG: hypothetical protein AUJ48_01290 [Deltaproteobacteria bacterium CG1_02_45_11]